jgi:hypothetical protein
MYSRDCPANSIGLPWVALDRHPVFALEIQALGIYNDMSRFERERGEEYL